jgi:hypothetical protein
MALEGGEGSASCPGCSLPPGKTPYPLYRRLGGPQGWSGQVQKILPPPGFDPRTIQPMASRYTIYATRPNFGCNTRWFKYDRDWFFLNHNCQTLTCTCQSPTYSPPESTHFFQCSGSILMPFSKKACGWRLVYTQISPGLIWTTFYIWFTQWNALDRSHKYILTLSSAVHAAYMIYSYLPSILEAASPSATWGCAMLCWQGSSGSGMWGHGLDQSGSG